MYKNILLCVSLTHISFKFQFYFKTLFEYNRCFFEGQVKVKRCQKEKMSKWNKSRLQIGLRWNLQKASFPVVDLKRHSFVFVFHFFLGGDKPTSIMKSLGAYTLNQRVEILTELERSLSLFTVKISSTSSYLEVSTGTANINLLVISSVFC